jgi:hypothetical protein
VRQHQLAQQGVCDRAAIDEPLEAAIVDECDLLGCAGQEALELSLRRPAYVDRVAKQLVAEQFMQDAGRDPLYAHGGLLLLEPAEELKQYANRRLLAEPTECLVVGKVRRTGRELS